MSLDSPRKYQHNQNENLSRKSESENLDNGSSLVDGEYESEEASEVNWLTRKEISDALGVSPQTFVKSAEQLRSERPELFSVRKNKVGRESEHFSSELLSFLYEDLNKHEVAPDGWLTNKGIADEHGVHERTVRTLAEAQKPEHPEWFVEYKTALSGGRGGVVRLHYAPELVNFITSNIATREKPGEGWKTNRALSVELGVSWSVTKRIAEEYREENPEWFKEFTYSNGKLAEHFSPELIEVIERRIKSREKAPEGWITPTKLVDQINLSSTSSIKKVADSYREEHPEWFKEYFPPTFDTAVEHYAPELADAIKKEFDNREIAPEDWMTPYALEKTIDFAGVRKIIALAEEYRDSNPEWFGVYHPPAGPPSEHYAPELLKKIVEKLDNREIAPEGYVSSVRLAKELGLSNTEILKLAKSLKGEEDDIYTYQPSSGKPGKFISPSLVNLIRMETQSYGKPPEGWVTITNFANSNKISKYLASKTIEKFKTKADVQHFKNLNNKLSEFYSPDLQAKVLRELSGHVEAPSGWKTSTELANDLGTNHRMIYKLRDQFRDDENVKGYRSPGGKLVEYLSPELQKVILDELTKYDDPPEGWKTINDIAKELNVTFPTVKKFLATYETEENYLSFKNPKTGQINNYLSPELQNLIKKEFPVLEFAPEGWKTINALQKEFGVGYVLLNNLRDRFASDEDIKIYRHEVRGTPREFLSPRLVELIIQHLEENQRKEIENERAEKIKLETENQCDEFLKSVIEGAKGNPEEFKKLISIFGIEQGFDVLYKYHPEFNGIDVEYVRSSIAKYLGDFLTIRTGVIHEDLELALPFLSETTYKDSLYESLKSDCLTSFHERKRANPGSSEEAILQEYIAEVREKTNSFANDDLNEVIDRVDEFYSALYSGMEKPSNVIEHLRPGRPFPDINQRLNIKEVADKKRMLIGDEMGMGKSASAILSKEYLGVERALVIVPSNVIGTWQRYLSDEVSPDGKPMGYFEQGQAPRVFVVENEQGLADINPDEYDYVVISQERLNDKYVTRLRDLDCGMVIVDEVHKLKNITEGERSQAALDLITSLDAESAYSVLLSGTPVPNKVGDVAVILKLLYPDRFNDWDNKALTSAIINGDILDLRSLLVPRMQMKSLQESVEMPEKQETILRTELTPAEEEVYELLLEDDDLTASQKIQALRKFVMNPSSLETTPLIESSKVVDVREHIRSAFEEHDKVVLIVNSYVDGIVKGEDNLLEKLHLPEGVETRVIYGEVSKEERAAIEKEVRESNGKLLLVLSGQTADVGVDFSSADHLVFYNDPWTLYDKQQQAARVYRPGLKHDLDIVTSVTEGTIEEGISEYIETKYKAIEKVLKGVPLTEIEKGLLQTNERQTTMDVEGDLEIAKEWLNSPQNRLHKFFGATKEIGEGKFQEFLQRYGDEYAEYYQEMGSRGFQANTSRVAGALINKFIEERGQSPEEVDILDSASGPFMLERHITDQLQERVYSLDINRSHFDKASEDREEGVRRSIVGSFVELNLPDEDFEYINMSLAFHYTKLDLRKKNYERLQALKEMNRVLKVGGRAVINFVHSMNLKNPEQFREAVEQLGFQVVEEYTGIASSGDSYASPCIVLEKVEHIDATTEEVASLIGKSGLDGLKLGKSEIPSLKNSRQVVHDFTINGEEIKVPFNLEDVVYALEEQEIFNEARELVKMYGSIGEIPKEEIIERDFLRIRVTKGSGEQSAKYRLFKRGEHAGGFIEFVK